MATPPTTTAPLEATVAKTERAPTRPAGGDKHTKKSAQVGQTKNARSLQNGQPSRNVLTPSNKATVVKQEPGQEDGVNVPSYKDLQEELRTVDASLRNVLRQHAVPLPMASGPVVTLAPLVQLMARLSAGASQRETHAVEALGQERRAHTITNAQLGNAKSDLAKNGDALTRNQKRHHQTSIKLKEATQKLAETTTQLARAQKELLDGRAELTSVKSELADKNLRFLRMQQELSETDAQLVEAGAEIVFQGEQVTELRKQLIAARGQHVDERLARESAEVNLAVQQRTNARMGQDHRAALAEKDRERRATLTGKDQERWKAALTRQEQEHRAALAVKSQEYEEISAKQDLGHRVALAEKDQELNGERQNTREVLEPYDTMLDNFIRRASELTQS